MTTDELISQMTALLKHGDHWQARAFGRDFFAKGKPPRQAMERALGLAKVAEDHWIHKAANSGWPAGATLPVDLNPNSDLF